MCVCETVYLLLALALARLASRTAALDKPEFTLLG